MASQEAIVGVLLVVAFEKGNAKLEVQRVGGWVKCNGSFEQRDRFVGAFGSSRGNAEDSQCHRMIGSLIGYFLGNLCSGFDLVVVKELSGRSKPGFNRWWQRKAIRFSSLRCLSWRRLTLGLVRHRCA